eukprot:TRINITY_DN16796_c3_g1_i1.p1 TRINITY_DN16796_c3_g1~~TRINITY_DN16796_c3_g1_i1.p1  ORF type:complete len:298 (-),score=37.41 TRINITY_DN16796_c3_g1_i1:119-1012(-)
MSAKMASYRHPAFLAAIVLTSLFGTVCGQLDEFSGSMLLLRLLTGENVTQTSSTTTSTSTTSLVSVDSDLNTTTTNTTSTLTTTTTATLTHTTTSTSTSSTTVTSITSTSSSSSTTISTTTTVDVSDWLRQIDGSVRMEVPMPDVFAKDKDAHLAIHQMITSCSGQPWGAVTVTSVAAASRRGGRLLQQGSSTFWPLAAQSVLVAEFVVLAKTYDVATRVESRIVKAYKSGEMLRYFQEALDQVGLGQWSKVARILEVKSRFAGSWSYSVDFSMKLIPRRSISAMIFLVFLFSSGIL